MRRRRTGCPTRTTTSSRQSTGDRSIPMPFARFGRTKSSAEADRPVTDDLERQDNRGALASRLRAGVTAWAPALPLLVVLAVFLIAPIANLLARSFITA